MKIPVFAALAAALLTPLVAVQPAAQVKAIANCPTAASPYSTATTRQLVGSRAGVTTYRYVRSGYFTQVYVSIADSGHAIPKPFFTAHVTQLAGPGALIRGSGAQAGVNGDFFRLGGDGSPIGVEATRKLVLKATNVWQNSLVTTTGGYLHYGQVRATISLTTHGRAVLVTGKNVPGVASNGATVYTNRWGRTVPSYPALREFIVSGGRVVAVHTRNTHPVILSGGFVVEATSGTASSLVTAGWKQGAYVSTAAVLRSSIPNASAAIGVGSVIVHNRLPYYGGCAADSATGRTVVGIYPGGKKVALMVASNGRGLTTRETVAFMRHLGVSEALMLDGGGSATLATASRQLTVPRYGTDRPVPNGFGLFPR